MTLLASPGEHVLRPLNFGLFEVNAERHLSLSLSSRAAPDRTPIPYLCCQGWTCIMHHVSNIGAGASSMALFLLCDHLLSADSSNAGLDARAAAIVMRTVRNIVNTGRTIVCTIHQPSIDIFEAFDELLLLKRGGECIFNGQLGKDSGRLIDYFSVCCGMTYD